MSNLITKSRLQAWRECQRLHRLRYLDGWRPRQDPTALRFGSLIHHGLEGWWRETQPGKRIASAMLAMHGRAGDPYEAALAAALIEAYNRRWLGSMAQYEVLLVERSFTAPLLNPATGGTSRTYLLAGKLDVFVRYLPTGDVLVVEHKTTTDDIQPGGVYWLKLPMDTQVSLYYLGAESFQLPVAGCLYDVLRKPQLQPLRATPEESRKYTKQGKLYANQREHDETPEEFGRRVAESIEKDPDRHFQRRDVPRTENDLRDFLADTWAEACTMREAELAGRAPRNPDACHRFGRCPFWDHCAHGVRLDEHPEHFERVDDVHPELELQESA